MVEPGLGWVESEEGKTRIFLSDRRRDKVDKKVDPLI
jgi:hypothetical protein